MKTKPFIVFLIGLFAFAIAMLEAIYFAKERIAFGDAAYQLFTIIRTDDLAIQVMRFGSAITQCVPLLVSKFNVTLSAVMLAYSISFELISIIAFLIILIYFKNLELAIVLILLKTLITTHTFFWVQSELLQGLVILPIFIAWLKDKYISRFNNSDFIVLFLFVFTQVFVHPLIVFPFLFSLFYILLFKPDGYDKRAIRLSVFLFIFISITKTILMKNAYDSSAMSGLSNFKNYFPHYINIPINKQFIASCKQDYYFIPILLFLNSILLLNMKRWYPLFFSTIYIAFYFLIVQITNYNGSAFYFRIESFYIPIAYMLSFVFILEASTSNSFRKIIIPLVCITLFFFILRVENASKIYTQQISWNRAFIKNNLNDKLVINEKDLPADTILLPWAFPYQTWILSTVENGKTVSNAVAVDPHSFDWTMWNKNAFITSWGIYEHNQLPTKFFIFKDDSIGYKHHVKSFN